MTGQDFPPAMMVRLHPSEPTRSASPREAASARPDAGLVVQEGAISDAAKTLSDREQAEVRHRLANIFQLLATLMRMRIQKASDEETRRQLTWMLDATGALGALQQRVLRPNGDDFGGYLHDMLTLWRSRCAGRPIQIDLDVQPLALREQVASALALIVHELVCNAIVHAFPDDRAGLVRIELHAPSEGRGEMIVTDDGCGYDPEQVGANHLGLWLIRGLASQVRGELTTRHDNGVSARLTFPI